MSDMINVGVELPRDYAECRETPKMVHSVLDTNYTIKMGSREEIGLHEDNMGECKTYAKEILICTKDSECDEKELRVRTQEIVAHEFLHAYFNEAGIELDSEDEEKICYFFMKNWRKLNNSILEVLDKSGFLDK